MNFVNQKISSFTGEALSEIQRRRKQNKQNPAGSPESQVALETQVNAGRANINLQNSADSRYSLGIQPTNQSLYPNAGFPFGGDSFGCGDRPPPIGFNFTNLDHSNLKPTAPPTDELTSDADKIERPDDPRKRVVESTESLYQGDSWSRLWFQRVMLACIVRLLLFIRKVYEDFHATKLYNLTGQSGQLIVATATLFLPTIVFTLYRISRYLQIALPPPAPLSLQDADQEKSGSKEGKDDTQSGRGPISSSNANQTAQSVASRPLVSGEDDGLVTARGTPTQLEEFHDSKSQQELAIVASSSPAPSTALMKPSPRQDVDKSVDAEFKEHVNVDKLGNLPDKQTTRIVLGASEQLLHGVLFVFWQLKRQVDVLGYLVERACLWRRPRPDELDEFNRLRTGSDGLEWFQDFYAAFLAILAQIYTLGVVWSAKGGNAAKFVSAAQANAAGGSAISEVVGSSVADGGAGKSVQTLGFALSQQALAGTRISGDDLLIVSEIVVSSAVIFSLLIAVRRRDDGPLTLALSMLGWGATFAARIIILAMAFVHIGWKIMLPLVALHILGIMAWIYKIAIDSHNDDPSETEEFKWNPDSDVGDVEQGIGQPIELQEGQTTVNKTKSNPPVTSTSRWGSIQHGVLLSQIVILFAIPSLFYWPIMFNLKLHLRPFKYTLLILSENFILIPTIWYLIGDNHEVATLGQWYLLTATAGLSVFGALAIYMYVCCKPNLTEYFARADELFNEAECSGIYYEFCSRVFKLPDLSKHAFRRLMNQTEIIEEEDVVEVDLSK